MHCCYDIKLLFSDLICLFVADWISFCIIINAKLCSKSLIRTLIIIKIKLSLSLVELKL